MDKYRRYSNVYITPEEILKMNDDDIICVNGSRIFAKLARLNMEGNKDVEAIDILLKASNELLDNEKKCKDILWGTKMTVKDVKIAFQDLVYMSRTAFKKII